MFRFSDFQSFRFFSVTFSHFWIPGFSDFEPWEKVGLGIGAKSFPTEQICGPKSVSKGTSGDGSQREKVRMAMDRKKWRADLWIFLHEG
jgi:hypothetical protein